MQTVNLTLIPIIKMKTTTCFHTPTAQLGRNSASMLTRACGVVALVGLAASAAANTITFDGLMLSHYDPIPASYKNHADDTPNVGVTYSSVDATGAVVVASISYWSTAYGDLEDVAFAASNGLWANITFTPDPGYKVNLISFDLAGWPNADQPGQTVRILDGNRNVVLDYSPFDITGTGHNSFGPNLWSTDSLTIEFGPSWNGGIDNIGFRQLKDDGGNRVPETGGSVFLLLLGVGGLGALGRLGRWHRAS